MYDELLLLVAKNHHQEVLQRLLEELTPMINKSHGNNKEYAQRIVMLYSNYTELETKRKLNNQSPQESCVPINTKKPI